MYTHTVALGRVKLRLKTRSCVGRSAGECGDRENYVVVVFFINLWDNLRSPKLNERKGGRERERERESKGDRERKKGGGGGGGGEREGKKETDRKSVCEGSFFFSMKVKDVGNFCTRETWRAVA